MAKARKNYHKKRPVWQWLIFYILIGGIIYSLLYYSGVLGFKDFNKNTNSEREVEYIQ